jgi:hypothetical protein
LRKILPILIVGILVLSGLGAAAVAQTEEENIISDKIVISKPKLTEKNEFILVDLAEANSNYWGEEKPFLPVVSKVYTFPLGTIVDDVDVTFSNVFTQKLTKLIEPTPEAHVISMVQTKDSIKTSSEVSYSDLDIYPQEQFSYTTAAGKQGKDNVIFCSVSINPVQYNTQENTITYAQNAEINIKYSPPASPITFPDDYDVLILTPSEFVSALDEYVQHKEGRGFRIKVVTIDEIPSKGIDEQEDIKYYVKDGIETWGVDYLILVGSGVEGNEKFPVRLVYIDGEYFASDLYYADVYNSTMGFPDWDTDNDEIYGEYPRDKPDMDVLPDIHLGKIPCNSEVELKAYIEKVIWYDEHNKMTKKIVQIGGDTFPGDAEGIYEGEFANEAVLDVLPGYTSYKNWASLNKLTKTNIADGYKKNLPDFYDFSGHGNIESWATHPPDDDSKWIPDPQGSSKWAGWNSVDFDIFLVRNPKKYPILFYNACSNNKYTKTDKCMAWKTLKIPSGGGIIAFGASGLGIGAHGSAEIERYFGWMEVNTHKELYTTKNLGEVWTNSVTQYYTTFQSTLKKYDYKTLVEFSMFGDPLLNAEDGDDPRVRSQPDPYFNFFQGVLIQFPRLIKLFELLFA